jgi:tRNA 5-methylaminomethyl-2-thiouridine biosynthesis bifunctional protein
MAIPPDHLATPPTQSAPASFAPPVAGIITPAPIDWHTDELGHTVPFSRAFGDVYYSLVDGLNESRYVFIERNQLPERFKQLFMQADNALAYQPTFTIAELGFGTGLNLLTTWQLWRELKAQYLLNNVTANSLTPRLHFISTEKFPLAKADLAQSLASWQAAEPELQPLIAKLLAQYPPLIEGCHRLHLADDVTLDLWLGDANDSLAKLDNSVGAAVDAWFLDGFAPSCNESLWAEQIFTQLQRLSRPGTTAATFSCAGVVKRGLRAAGFHVTKVKGFGRKREMLTATVPDQTIENASDNYPTVPLFSHYPRRVTIIGAGVSGLMSAWTLAQRGIQVLLLDKTAPLAGASGNPRALLAPKMTPIHHVAEHLHTTGYLYSGRLYRQLDNKTAAEADQAIAVNAPIFTPTGMLDLLTKANIDTQQIALYPDDLATTLANEEAQTRVGLTQQDFTENLYLPQSGLINPYALAQTLLAHPLITFKQRQITQIDSPINSATVRLICADGEVIETERVLIAAAYASYLLESRIFDFRKIRGQLSWFSPTAEQLKHLPKLPLKYAGYCTPFTPQLGDEQLNTLTPGQPQFLFGASFVRNDTATEVRESEHQVNYTKLITALPELAAVVSPETTEWQARAGIRAQTPDYHPLVGPVGIEPTQNCYNDAKIWTLSGMGSKGYAYAPICAEALADIMTGSFAPLSEQMLAKLSPNRARLQTALQN